MKHLYYRQGIHAVRVKMDYGIIMDVERYDRTHLLFVSDFKMLGRINDDMDTQKLSLKEFWELVAQLRNFSLN